MNEVRQIEVIRKGNVDTLKQVGKRYSAVLKLGRGTVWDTTRWAFEMSCTELAHCNAPLHFPPLPKANIYTRGKRRGERLATKNTEKSGNSTGTQRAQAETLNLSINTLLLCMLYVICCMLCVVCCMLNVVCCMSVSWNSVASPAASFTIDRSTEGFA